MGIISSLSTEEPHPKTTKMKLIILLWAACLVVHVKGDLGVRKIVFKNGGKMLGDAVQVGSEFS